MSVVANVAINVDARSAVGQLKAVQSQAKQTEQAFDGVSAAVGKLAIAAAAIQGARFIFAKTAELETQTRSLQVLTGSVEKAKRIIEELQQLGAVTPFTSTELIDTAKRLQAFGVTADKVVETTRRLADVSGATGAELQGLATAYGQVQAKGRLQGEELLQFQERGVALQEELRKMYGLSGEAFQEALSKGRISAEAVEVAITRLTDAGGKYANGAIAQSDTLTGKLSTLQDGVDELARKVGQVLQPAVKSVLDYVINNIGQANQLIVDMGLAWQFVTGKLQPFIDGLTIVQSALNNLRPPAWMITGLVGSTGPGQIFNWMQRGRNVIGAMAAQQRGKADLYGRYASPATQTRIGQQVGAIPPLLGAAGGKAGGGGSGRAGKSEAEKQAEILQKSYATGVQIGVELTRQLKLQNATNEFEEKRLKIQFEYRDRIKQISELKNKEQRNILDARAAALRDLELAKLKTEELVKQREELENIQKAIEDAAGADWSAFGGQSLKSFTSWGAAMEETQRQLDELTNPINQVVVGATAIGSAFAESFRGIVAGSMTAQEAMANLFRSIGNHFFDMAAQIASAALTNTIVQFIGKALGSGLGSISGIAGGGFGGGGIDWGQTPSIGGVPSMFASGGFVTGPTSAIVGEGGQPEYVIPASKMRGAMERYAGGARGAAVIPGNDQASGGSEGGAATATAIDVRYSVERINSVDYVTADQFQRGMQQAAAQGAQRGEQATLRRLQQSTSTRRRIGM